MGAVTCAVLDLEERLRKVACVRAGGTGQLCIVFILSQPMKRS